jgi:hypothetical protein
MNSLNCLKHVCITNLLHRRSATKVCLKVIFWFTLIRSLKLVGCYVLDRCLQIMLNVFFP